VRDKIFFKRETREITLVRWVHACLLFPENTMAREICFPKTSYEFKFLSGIVEQLH